jgi:hypothetical protein
MYRPNSRYAASKTLVWSGPGGRQIAYTAVRTCPDDRRTGQQVQVAHGDRLDLFSAALFGDPTEFWRIADANHALDPFALTDTPGRRLTLPGRR